jgi:phage portal protein BeeE
VLAWIKRLWGGAGAEDVALLRAELQGLKAAVGGPSIVAGAGGPFAPRPGLASAREQLSHYRGWTYASVRPIAQKIAGQPVRVARKAGGRAPGRSKMFDLAPAWVKGLPTGLEILESHPLLDALADPNEVMTSWALLYTTVASLELTGKSFWWLRQDAGKPQIWPLPTPWVRPVHSARLFASYEIQPPGGEAFPLDGNDVARFYYPSPADPLGAVSPLGTQAAAVAADEAIQTSQRVAFTRGLNIGLALIAGRVPDERGATGPNQPRYEFSESQKDQLIGAIRQRYAGVMAAGEPLILDRLIEDVKPITTSPREMDFLRSGASTKARVFQGFGTNPIIAGEIEGANRASALAASDHFNEYTVNPKIELISQTMTAWLAPRFEPGLVVWIERAEAVDPDAVRADRELLAKHGAVTLDELRGWYGLPPLPSGGDQLVSPGGAPALLASFEGEGTPAKGGPFREGVRPGDAGGAVAQGARAGRNGVHKSAANLFPPAGRIRLK